MSITNYCLLFLYIYMFYLSLFFYKHIPYWEINIYVLICSCIQVLMSFCLNTSIVLVSAMDWQLHKCHLYHCMTAVCSVILILHVSCLCINLVVVCIKIYYLHVNNFCYTNLFTLLPFSIYVNKYISVDTYFCYKSTNKWIWKITIIYRMNAFSTIIKSDALTWE